LFYFTVHAVLLMSVSRSQNLCKTDTEQGGIGLGRISLRNFLYINLRKVSGSFFV